MVLGPAGIERRHLRGPGAVLAALFHADLDLGAAAGELVDRGARDALDLGGTVSDRRPLDPESAGELFSELGLIEVAGRLGVAVEEASVERAPLTVVAVNQVRHQCVGMKKRIAGARGPVAEGSRHESGRVDRDDAVGPPAPEGGVAFEVVEGEEDGRVVGVDDLVGSFLRAEGVEQ